MLVNRGVGVIINIFRVHCEIFKELPQILQKILGKFLKKKKNEL